MHTSTTVLQQALRSASTHRLRDVIDWLERPWAPGRNDALRAMWHAARRDRAAHSMLAEALAHEVHDLGVSTGARDLAHVARRLELAFASVEGVAYEIARRVDASGVGRPVPDVVASAVHAALDVARIVLRDANGGRSRGRRRHRHGL